MLPLAHSGHWAVSLLYLAPVVILVGALFVTRARDGRAAAEEDEVFASGAFDDDLDGPA